MSEIPMTVVEPTEIVKTTVAFPMNKMVLLGLIGMVGALALLLFQAMHERDEYRQAYNAAAVPPTGPLSANGKYDGPVTTPESTEAHDAGTASTEV